MVKIVLGQAHHRKWGKDDIHLVSFLYLVCFSSFFLFYFLLKTQHEIWVIFFRFGNFLPFLRLLLFFPTVRKILKIIFGVESCGRNFLWLNYIGFWRAILVNRLQIDFLSFQGFLAGNWIFSGESEFNLIFGDKLAGEFRSLNCFQLFCIEINIKTKSITTKNSPRNTSSIPLSQHSPTFPIIFYAQNNLQFNSRTDAPHTHKIFYE